VLYREPKLLKDTPNYAPAAICTNVSVLYREPKLLKAIKSGFDAAVVVSFSALP